MSLNQKLNEFRFNLETLDLLNNMGKSTQLLSELGFNSELLVLMQNNRNLLNSVLLRLQLYSEQNMSELKVRSGLSMLNNQSVNSLLDYLYKSSTEELKVDTKSKPSSPKLVKELVKEQVKESIPEPEEETLTTDENQEHESAAEEENYFDKFFSDCVQVSDDATHVVKMSAMYDAFNKWWSNTYEDEVPSKDELKDYLSSRFNRQIKSTISNVSLI
jgi:hypothetical protein